MIKTLRDSKARLSELVDRASHGEEVLITVRGRIKARLTGAEARRDSQDRAAWVENLRALQKTIGKRRLQTKSDDILSEIREERQ
jgi:prevent-host-death family protein